MAYGPFDVDSTPPTLTYTINGSTGHAPWYGGPVTIAFSCADAGSGVDRAGCPQPVTLTQEGRDQSLAAAVTDVAGNATTVSIAGINIDLTRPALAAAAQPAPNLVGWNNTDVVVHWTCTDPDLVDGQAGAGVDGCPADQQVSAEGFGQVISGSARDHAGNRASATALVNVDKTAPTLAGTAAQAPNSAGWYRGDVTVDWTAEDAAGGSGIDPSTVPAAAVIGGEGSGLSAAADVSDLASNTGRGTVAGIRIDRTPPKTQLTAAPPAWSSGAVTLDLAASDNLSGVTRTAWSVDGGAAQDGSSVAIAGEGRHTLTFWSQDRAGNAERPIEVAVNIDQAGRPSPSPSSRPPTPPAGTPNRSP